MPREKKVVLDKAPEVVIPETGSIVDEIVWCSKSRNRIGAYGRKDVGLTMSRHKKNNAHKNDYYTLTFSFRDNIERSFSKDDNICLIYGIVKNRMYFKPTEPKTGYKVTKKHNNAYMQVTVTNNMMDKVKEFCPGEYHLKYDDSQELYYVELEE